ncbi:DUF2812 domain-containing protein [Paenibacillus sp. MCAF9]|uniref:DUF2812 domain-containing protein n=1 Tax=Paenibacillus sp. MCAF9 TaxID=3233046 RepID=UPI003F9A1F93
MINEKRVTKWWVSWDSEKIERWLEQEEAEGWHLRKVSGNVVRFHFQKGETRKLRYCLDYQMNKDPNYVQLFKEAGWELVYSSAGWYIWRMPYSEVRPEIYSDLDSLIDRNKRILSLLSVVLFAQFPIILINIFPLQMFNPWSMIILGLYMIVVGLFVYGIIRIVSNNRMLIKRRDLHK